jgi:hypothetical protein
MREILVPGVYDWGMMASGGGLSVAYFPTSCRRIVEGIEALWEEGALLRRIAVCCLVAVRPKLPESKQIVRARSLCGVGEKRFNMHYHLRILEIRLAG